MKRLISVCLAAAAIGIGIWMLAPAGNSSLEPSQDLSTSQTSQTLRQPEIDAGEQICSLTSMNIASEESQAIADQGDAKQPVLFKVSISPEARVKATAVESSRDLSAGQWTTFRITIENAAGITAPLFIESEQVMHSETDTDRDRWMQVTLEPDGPLTGSPRETRTLRLYSRDTGIRTALLNVNAGQGTQDLGFRSDVLLSFHIAER